MSAQRSSSSLASGLGSDHGVDPSRVPLNPSHAAGGTATFQPMGGGGEVPSSSSSSSWKTDPRPSYDLPPDHVPPYAPSFVSAPPFSSPYHQQPQHQHHTQPYPPPRPSQQPTVTTTFQQQQQQPPVLAPAVLARAPSSTSASSADSPATTLDTPSSAGLTSLGYDPRSYSLEPSLATASSGAQGHLPDNPATFPSPSTTVSSAATYSAHLQQQQQLARPAAYPPRQSVGQPASSSYAHDLHRQQLQQQHTRTYCVAPDFNASSFPQRPLPPPSSHQQRQMYLRPAPTMADYSSSSSGPMSSYPPPHAHPHHAGRPSTAPSGAAVYHPPPSTEYGGSGAYGTAPRWEAAPVDGDHQPQRHSPYPPHGGSAPYYHTHHQPPSYIHSAPPPLPPSAQHAHPQHTPLTISPSTFSQHQRHYAYQLPQNQPVPASGSPPLSGSSGVFSDDHLGGVPHIKEGNELWRDDSRAPPAPAGASAWLASVGGDWAQPEEGLLHQQQSRATSFAGPLRTTPHSSAHVPPSSASSSRPSSSQRRNSRASSATDEDPSRRRVRYQVKNACTSCQKLHKPCDDQRPCKRCTRRGPQYAEACVDSGRKPKRGTGARRKRENEDQAEAGEIESGLKAETTRISNNYAGFSSGGSTSPTEEARTPAMASHRSGSDADHASDPHRGHTPSSTTSSARPGTGDSVGPGGVGIGRPPRHHDQRLAPPLGLRVGHSTASSWHADSRQQAYVPNSQPYPQYRPHPNGVPAAASPLHYPAEIQYHQQRPYPLHSHSHSHIHAYPPPQPSLHQPQHHPQMYQFHPADSQATTRWKEPPTLASAPLKQSISPPSTHHAPGGDEGSPPPPSPRSANPLLQAPTSSQGTGMTVAATVEPKEELQEELSDLSYEEQDDDDGEFRLGGKSTGGRRGGKAGKKAAIVKKKGGARRGGASKRAV